MEGNSLLALIIILLVPLLHETRVCKQAAVGKSLAITLAGKSHAIMLALCSVLIAFSNVA